MQPLSIALGDCSYPIYVGRGLLSRGDLLEAHLPRGALCVVTNVTVAPLYLPALRQALGARRIVECVLPDGEQHKSLATLSTVFDALVDGRVHRDGAILALGGGVVGDMAGFAAACYQRGIACAQLPTTLLSQVDSSVGGKTAVNHPGGKNLIGAFHQPCAVYADTDTLATLPDRELRAGLAEVVKYGLLEDAAFFAWLEEHIGELVDREPEALAQAIRRSCEIKAAVVAEDERETSGRRALLNLGHTFGHAIETAVHYKGWLHGEAVAVGLLLAADLSARLGMIEAGAVERVRALLCRAGLPVTPPPVAAAELWRLMQMDKKVADGRVTLVLLDRPGRAVLRRDVPEAAVMATLEAAAA
jgi:3-dehydroquinate synthase